MEVTCGVCGAESALSESCDDRANWIPVTESQVVIDEVEGTVIRDIPVANSLIWLCPCGETNTVTEEV